MFLLRITMLATLGLIAFWSGQRPQALGQEKSETPAVPSSPLAKRLPGLKPTGGVLLPNGWSLNPAGQQIAVGDFPVTAAITRDGKYAAVLHAGYGEHLIQILSLAPLAQVSSVKLDQAFVGLTFIDQDRRLVASGAEDEVVYCFDFVDGLLSNKQVLRLAPDDAKWVVSGLTEFRADSPGEIGLLVCGLLANEVAVAHGSPWEVTQHIALPAESYPYQVVVDNASHTAYVSLWGTAKVGIIDLDAKQLLSTLDVGSHPTEMVLVDEGKYLMVACSNDNSVHVIDLEAKQTREVISTSLYPKAPNGSTTCSLGLSPDQRVLAVANADNNHLAIFDISERGKSHSLGFIPTGWYPTCVRFSPDGESLLVTNGKGESSHDNRLGPNPLLKQHATVREYIGGLMKGSVSLIAVPTPEQMAKHTKTAYACSPLAAQASEKAFPEANENAIPSPAGGSSPIEHCLYIIKENRTYDQILGDVPQGNGDASLCIFPELVTPNHHALAREFVLLDNFYVESEVSADGHEWTMAAYATDFVEKTWPLTYRGGRGKLSYPAEGKLKIARPSSGYFWDRCREKGLSYFSFGEFIVNGPTLDAPSTTKVEALQGHFDPQFRGYDLDYSDIMRAERFLTRWKQFEADGNLPRFIVLRLPNDHTFGTRLGKKTPTAMVAENDLALGKIIESISHGPSWKKTAIFVIEDDAQNGADHVDAHRTIAFAISPYVKRGTVDSTMYSTASMLRTMGLILGLEPMTQFDAAATPMYQSFTNKPDATPYDARPASVDIHALNTAEAYGVALSEKLDLSTEDAADDLLFGDIVWRSVKGADSPMPAPVRAAFVYAEMEDDEDEEEEVGGDSGDDE